jgi:hypothetical protein
MGTKNEIKNGKRIIKRDKQQKIKYVYHNGQTVCIIFK